MVANHLILDLNNVQTISTTVNFLFLSSGVDLDDVVSVNGTQVISGETTFTSDLQVDALSVNGSLVITGLLNGVNVSDLAFDTLQKSGRVEAQET